MFVHISAFPRDGRRPQLGEALTFEVEPAGDGKKAAAAAGTAALVRGNRDHGAVAGGRGRLRVRSVQPRAVRLPASHGERARALGTAAAGTGISMRRPDALLADDLMRGSEVLPQALPRHADGWRRRRSAVRSAVVLGTTWPVSCARAIV